MQVYKGNRYHPARIAVSKSWNRGMAENGTSVLQRRNGSSESPRILIKFGDTEIRCSLLSEHRMKCTWYIDCDEIKFIR